MRISLHLKDTIRLGRVRPRGICFSSSTCSCYMRLIFTPNSGTSTPVPPDAPPSVQATSSARKALSAQNRRRIFPTVDYDPRSNYHNFRGFFVLFWIGLAIMVMTTMLRNFKETGSPFLFRQRKLFLENIWSLAVSDLVMSGSIMVSYPLHIVFYRSTGILQWDKAGVWIQSVYQLSWLAFWTASVSIFPSKIARTFTNWHSVGHSF